MGDGATPLAEFWSARLGYRRVSHQDLDLFADFLGDEETTRYLIVPRAHSRAEAATLLDRWAAQHDGTIGMYTVLERDRPVGWVGFVRRALRWGDELELGWSLFPAHQGRGYATEAARALREIVPGRVIALIRVENDASKNVARKLGMEREREIVWNGFATDLFAI